MTSSPTELIRRILQEGREKLDEDEELRRMLEKRPRIVLVRVGGEEIRFDTRTLLETGDDPQIEVHMDEDTFWGLVRREVDPSIAYLSGKIKIKASLADKVYFGKVLKRLLGKETLK